MNNEQIFETLTIKNLKGVRFGDKLAQCETKGFALYSKEYGYLSFNNVVDYGIELPYNPRGGKKVLAELLKTGLTDYSNIGFVKAY